MFEAEPVDKAASDAVMFGKFVEFVDDDAINEAIVGRARYGAFAAEKSEKFVEKFAAEFLNEAVLCVVVADAGYDFGALFPFFDEFWDEFWWLLPVCINGNGGVAFGVL